ncbi:hypothetical protein CR513_41386, partial [Mucuna pruriens]
MTTKHFASLKKCFSPTKANNTLTKVHEGMKSFHLGRKSLAREVLHASYYWVSLKVHTILYTNGR